MICPKCEKEMIVVERNDVELDYCMFCEGFWFDNYEWNILCKKLIAEDFVDNTTDIYSIPKSKSDEEKRICPVCGRKMEKFMLYDVLLDRCPSRCGIWFDKNEFSSCVNAIKSNLNSKSNTQEQIKFLGEVFRV